MVKDILITALGMLGKGDESDKLTLKTAEITKEMLRCYNLVISELCSEHKLCKVANVPIASLVTDKELVHEGFTSRVIAYGICAEYCISLGHEDSELWDKRYKDARNMVISPNGKVRARQFM